MKYVVSVLAAVCVLTGCFHTNIAPAQDPRVLARAATDLAKDAWVVTASACLAAAETAQDDSIRATCAKYLTPAHDAIATAADAVDSQWTDSAACSLFQGTTLVLAAAKDLPASGITTTVADAVTMAANLASASCVRDAGSE